jgi:hypothetical protein
MWAIFLSFLYWFLCEKRISHHWPNTTKQSFVKVSLSNVVPLPVEHKAEMKLGMAACAHPLINKYSHILAGYSKNGLSKDICADQHMTPQTTANLLLCCI